MNLNPSNKKSLGINIKKIKILTFPKNPSMPVFCKNRTPTLKQIPFLLRCTSNNSTNITTIPLRKKLLSLLKEKNSRKSYLQISRYLFDEPSESDIKADKNFKSNLEMRNKFYKRKRKLLKNEFESEKALNIINETPSSLLHLKLDNKASLKNKKYNEENPINNEDKYFRRKFYRNRSDNSLLYNKMKASNKMNKSKENKEKKHSLFIRSKSSSLRYLHQQQRTINECNYYEKENLNNKFYFKYRKLKPKFQKIADRQYELFKKILRKRSKKNAKMFLQSLFNIQDDNYPYEPIYEKDIVNNLMHKVYFNNNNLDRLIKVEKTNKKGYNEDDIINNAKDTKKFNENIEFLIKKLKQTNAPRTIKVNNFSRSTMIKYNNLLRNNFGIPN